MDEQWKQEFISSLAFVSDRVCQPYYCKIRNRSFLCALVLSLTSLVCPDATRCNCYNKYPWSFSHDTSQITNHSDYFHSLLKYKNVFVIAVGVFPKAVLVPISSVVILSASHGNGERSSMPSLVTNKDCISILKIFSTGMTAMRNF